MIVHGSCVVIGGRAVLILGPSGSGKSTLALALMARGGVLVADDRTLLEAGDGRLYADAPETLRGMIEARGVGILAADAAGRSEVTVVVDLSSDEPERLPPRRERALLGVSLPLVQGPMRPHFDAVIVQFLLKGRAV